MTVERQLELMRGGYDQDLKIKYGDLEIKCRLMNASEEAQVVANAKKNVKAPDESMRQSFEGLEIMKCIIEKGCNVNSTPYASRSFLDKLTTQELEDLYDQYVSLIRTANPKLEKLTDEQIVNFISAIKKKETTSKSLFMWQRAEIGRYFLEVLLPMAN